MNFINSGVALKTLLSTLCISQCLFFSTLPAMAGSSEVLAPLDGEGKTSGRVEALIEQYGEIQSEDYWYSQQPLLSSVTPAQRVHKNKRATQLVEDILNRHLNLDLYRCLSDQYGDDYRVQDIEVVRCADYGITTLDGIESLSSLRVLDLHNSGASLALNQIDSIQQLLGPDGSTYSNQLETINFSGMYLHSSTPLWESLNKHLHFLVSLRHLNLSNTSLDVLPTFTSPLGPTLSLLSLHLTGNQLQNIEALSGLLALHYLFLDDNPLGHSAFDPLAPLGKLEQMVSVSLNNIGLSGQLRLNGLPSRTGFVSLKDNAELTEILMPSHTSHEILYYIDLEGTQNLSCRSLDEVSYWFNQQRDLPSCVGSTILGPECLSPQYINLGVVASDHCRPNAPESLLVDEHNNDLDYTISWNRVPRHWDIAFYRVWYRESEFRPNHFVQVSANKNQVKVRPSNLSFTDYEFAIQACSELEELIQCGDLSQYQRSTRQHWFWSRKDK